MIIAVDFDGTCVTHAFPGVGEEIEGFVLKLIVQDPKDENVFTIVLLDKKGKEHKMVLKRE